MVNAFTIYDLVFFGIFTLAAVIFLYTHKKNLKREGLLYLYRTSFGIRFIENFTKKYSKVLKPLQYLVIISGYFLMVSMVYLLIKFTWIYLTSPVIAQAIRVPVLIPLIPYLPEIFKIDFLPPFNFTYWIVIIAILAVPHEFAHGIFARLNKIRIHSTGFGFLGPFLAAFVEQDDKDMLKASKFAQLSVLAAGTFANILTMIIFGLIFWIFFTSAFIPAGVNFNTYSTQIINTSDLVIPDNFSLNDEFISLMYNGKEVYTSPKILQQTTSQELPYTLVYEDTPAFKARLKGAISEIDSKKITSYEDLSLTLKEYSPGQSVNIKTIYQESIRTNKVEVLEYDLTLAERDGKAFLGIGFSQGKQSGIIGSIYLFVSKIKDPLIYYESQLGAFGWFVYFLLWWIMIILASVALVNMLPVGIFDGGRFFFLTIWAITGSKKIGEKAFKLSTYLILFIVAAMMVKWIFLFI